MAARRPISITDAALRMLGRKELTACELSARLTAKGYEVAAINELCERFRSWGYLNDAAVAERAVADCLARRPRGRFLIRQELAARGVATAVIEEAMSAYPAAAEEGAALAALTRLGIRLPLRPEDRPRAWRTLGRLGFAEPIIERICGLPNA